MSNYQPTIGLEIHTELKTKTKMFCDSLNDPEEKHPNTNVCPVCLGHPGTLPTINKKAVEEVIKAGLVLGGKINPVAKFDRKNYFYPDLPKGYQISQYDQPLVSGGGLNGVRIKRIHLEEDTGTLGHESGSSASLGQRISLVDFNRAGVPLMELVTEPDLKSAEEVVSFAKELQLILRYLNVSDADMEKGQMRIEANVSLNMGTKVELKNINSFRFAKEAIEYEVGRQIKALEKGEKIHQETRGWDENKKKTVSQRSKEEAHDYRYFPEPDLPPFETGVFDLEKLRAELPELPQAKRARLMSEYGLPENQAELIRSDADLAKFFEESASEFKELSVAADCGLLANYILSDLRGLMNDSGIGFGELKFGPEHLAHLLALISQKKITSRKAKDLLSIMFRDGRDPEEILSVEGFEAISDETKISEIVKVILEENPAAVADYKKGKSQAVQFLTGKTMAKLRGAGDPQVIQKVISKLLGQS